MLNQGHSTCSENISDSKFYPFPGVFNTFCSQLFQNCPLECCHLKRIESNESFGISERFLLEYWYEKILI